VSHAGEGAGVPVNIMVGLFSLLVALVLYSTGTWRAFRAGRFTAGVVAGLAVGALFDVLATVMMGWQIGGLDLRPGAPLAHTAIALVAMGGMIGGTTAGAWSRSTGRAALERMVSRLLLVPWALWLAVFVWGMLTRGAARITH
jgi:hypothetical protein